jgi:hypothetical protein
MNKTDILELYYHHFGIKIKYSRFRAFKNIVGDMRCYSEKIKFIRKYWNKK